MKSKGIMPILLLIVAILVIVLVVTNLNKNNNGSGQNVDNNANGTTAKNITESKQGDVDVSEVSITSDGTMTNVTAQVTNNSSITYSMVDISVIFYDKDKVALSTAKGLIENLAAGEKKGFSSSITGDFSKSYSYEVKVEKAQ
ncbi:MAG: hypothetical protein K0R72_1159 [Clostridia bacterium]|jgi:archaellum component FlaF (FlaF/FlaG flagellin family)|nr:hypothetical protein [Clostridia bacterium]